MSDVTSAPDHSDEIVIEEERRRVNGTGLAALVIVILSFVAPVAIGFGGAVLVQREAVGLGESFIGIVLSFAIALLVAVVLAVIGIVIAIISLFRKNRGKVLGITSLVLGIVPIVIAVIGATAFSTVIGVYGQG